MSTSKQDEALAVAESLLEDIEMGRLDALTAVRRAMRLARLTDDADAASWLLWELQGYPGEQGYLRKEARNWAYISGRVVEGREANDNWPKFEEGKNYRVNPAALSRLALIIETGAPLLTPEAGVTRESAPLFREVATARRILTDVVTAVHLWAGGVQNKLRFGSAAETAFGVVRREVDESISSLVPDGLAKLSAAFQNAASDQPEHWANAASTCRRLLKAAADALSPPGPDKNGRKMGDENYINRLMDWIEQQANSDTAAAVITEDLQHLGRRLEAAVGAGHKGAHAEVTRFDASRFITGTYLLLGDILRLRSTAG